MGQFTTKEIIGISIGSVIGGAIVIVLLGIGFYTLFDRHASPPNERPSFWSDRSTHSFWRPDMRKDRKNRKSTRRTRTRKAEA